MKRILPLTAILFVLSFEIFSQTVNVPKRKKALLMKMTATWCGPCGYYHPITDNIYHQHGDSIVFINAHVSSSDVGDKYSGDFHNALNGNGEGIPSYNVDGIKQPSWPPLENAILDSARRFLKRPVVANVAFRYQITGTQLSVQASVKFFVADKADEYYVNVFVLENSITTKQKVDVTYETLVQDRVSRGPIMSGNSGIWGEKIASGSIASGKFYDVTFNSTLQSAWIKNNLKVVAVLWKKTNNKYYVLSAEDVPDKTNGITDPGVGNLAELVVYPNPASEEVNVSVNGNGNIVVINALGQSVLSKDFKTNSNQIVSITTSQLQSGIYFLKINQNGEVATRKIVIQNGN